MTLRGRLRRACAWYEWSNRAEVADALQAAADAYDAGDLSPEAAGLILELWRPHAALEARVGHDVESYHVADTPTEVERGIVVDFRGCIARATDTARRAHLIELMDRQIRIFAKGKPSDPRYTIDP